MPTEKRRYLSDKEKMVVLARQNMICACRSSCTEPLTFGRIRYDHVLPLWAGGSNDLSNFAALVYGHHQDKTNIEATARAKADRIAASDGLRRKRLSKREKEMARILERPR